jgi:osmoprotectant transport system ATP-binding protein
VATLPSLLGWDRTRIASRVDELLTLVGLDPSDFRARWPDELSGGQRQRVGLARALAADPPLLLMDEPFGALDPITRSELHGEFRRVKTVIARAVIIVTHDIGEAMQLADRVAVLHEGRIIACAPGVELQRSDDPRVAALVATRLGLVPPKLRRSEGG